MSEDSDIDSFISSQKRSKVKGETTLGELLGRQTSRLQELSTKREALKQDTLVQCKVNERKFESLLDKKKRAKHIQEQLLGMTQEFKLMQKLIERKEKKAKELHHQVDKAKFYSEVRNSRKEVKEKFKEEIKQTNKEQVKKGLKIRDMSVKQKQQLIENLKKQKHQMYLECKQKAKSDEEKKRTDVGSSVNQKLIQAKENKINEELGNLTKRSYTKKKIDELSSQISFRIKKYDNGINNLKGNVNDLLKSQITLKKKLEKANKEFEQDYQEALKMNLVPDQSRSRLGKSVTFNYNFSGFQEKANRAQFLFFEEERKKKDFQEEVGNVKKQVELSLRLHESMPGINSKQTSSGKELNLRFF